MTILSSASSASLGKDPLKGTRLCLKAMLPVVLWARREKHTKGELNFRCHRLEGRGVLQMP